MPILPKDTLRVYYEGSKLVGDIKRSVAIELIGHYQGIKVNSPSIFKIAEDKIYLESLPELMDSNIDLNSIKVKINKIINA